MEIMSLSREARRRKSRFRIPNESALILEGPRRPCPQAIRGGILPTGDDRIDELTVAKSPRLGPCAAIDLVGDDAVGGTLGVPFAAGLCGLNLNQV